MASHANVQLIERILSKEIKMVETVGEWEVSVLVELRRVQMGKVGKGGYDLVQLGLHFKS